MILGLCVVLAGMLVPSAASASSGQITRALANSDWTLGSFAMSVTWDGTECPEAQTSCAWRPIATVQPTLPSYTCKGNEATDTDPNTKVVWDGGTQTPNSAGASFDGVNVPILEGVVGQRLCLSVIGTGLHLVMAQTLLTVESSQPPPTQPPATSQPSATSPVASKPKKHKHHKHHKHHRHKHHGG
jgi:hypothetical protein